MRLCPAEVAAQLKKAELEDLAAGRAGIQLEEMQQRLVEELKATTTLTAERRNQIEELRIALVKKLKAFRNLQEAYMPAVAQLVAEEEGKRNPELEPTVGEETPLWLPSTLALAGKRDLCRTDLLDAEARLREAQCDSGLTKVRSLLFAKSHLVIHRNTNVVGQKGSTRFGTLIGRLTARLVAQQTRYNVALGAAGYQGQG
ncbi:hypothetical protein HMN09_00475000 [Mycena chlorophos]|uniref:Uncharacterized protein n=1 Tax=Mycena chlorophos TaxID=658473 RepID=A0A8H6WH27_MYCCL|nr:hypothetical protein HMN09_00475000 [Mycena chlorophos]